MRKAVIMFCALFVAALSVEAPAVAQQGATPQAGEQSNERLKAFLSLTLPPPVPPEKASADKSQLPPASLNQPALGGGFKSGSDNAPAH